MSQYDDLGHEKFLKRLGKQIAKVRKSKGYSQDRLSLEAGLARGTLSKIEAGMRDSRASTLYRIAETLDQPIGRLFDFKNK